jgi:hypothetical protein
MNEEQRKGEEYLEQKSPVEVKPVIRMVGRNKVEVLPNIRKPEKEVYTSNLNEDKRRFLIGLKKKFAEETYLNKQLVSVYQSVKDMSLKLYNSFIDWLTVDEDETKPNTNN